MIKKRRSPVGCLDYLVQRCEKLAVDERKTNNKEVNLGFTGEEAMSEAERCMRCYYISMVAV